MAGLERPPDRQSEPVTWQLHCRACGRAVTIQFEAGFRPDSVAVWRCPYHDCGRDVLALADVRGDQLSSWTGHGPKPGE